MAITQAGDGRATTAIEILFAVSVIQVNAFTTGNHWVLMTRIAIKYITHKAALLNVG